MLLSTVLAGVAVLAAPAADPELKRFAFDEPHMGTRFGLIVHATDRATAERAAKAAFARVDTLNTILSDYQSTSELMRLCSKAGGEPVKVSAELFAVLRRARAVSEQSDGAFDVTVGPVVRLWRLARRTRRLPDPDRLRAARALVGWKNVELDEKAQTVRLRLPGMQLDLGGIGKGYTADEMHKVLKAHGITRALVAAGGDITVSDPPPGKAGWTVEIEAVDAATEGRRTLLLARASVSTSGDANQYANIDGVKYSHIVDPRTGLGLVGRMSATVIAPDGITADSLTKVVAVLGPEKGFKVLERYRDVSGRLVTKTDAGTRVVTSPTFPRPAAWTKER
ncbi:MAG: FAD:protein FMN transferase [Gemmataceae bacterium]